MIGFKDKQTPVKLSNLRSNSWKYVFIQSTSRIRVLPGGTHFIYCELFTLIILNFHTFWKCCRWEGRWKHNNSTVVTKAWWEKVWSRDSRKRILWTVSSYQRMSIIRVYRYWSNFQMEVGICILWVHKTRVYFIWQASNTDGKGILWLSWM